MLDRGCSGSAEGFVDAKSARTAVLGHPSTKSSTSEPSFSKSRGVHLSGQIYLVVLLFPCYLLKLSDKHFEADSCFSFACSVPCSARS